MRRPISTGVGNIPAIRWSSIQKVFSLLTWAATLRKSPSNYTAASPTRLVTSSSPPTLLIHGGRDELVSVYQSERLAQRLREAGVRHFNLALPWATHGFDYILRGPGGQISNYAIEYFLS